MNITAELSNLTGAEARRVLLVDDNQSIHDDFRKILAPEVSERQSEFEQAKAFFLDEEYGPQPTVQMQLNSAMQGCDAVDMVQAAVMLGRPYMLAFVDMRMPPGWDGLETIRRIWEIDPDIQIVMCTAYSDYSWKDICKAVGLRDNFLVVKKPFDNIEVLQLAHTLSQKWLLGRAFKAHLKDLNRVVDVRTKELTRTLHDLQKESAERAQAQERFKRAFHENPQAMVIVDYEGAKITEANESFFALCGAEPETVIHAALNDLRIFTDNDLETILQRTCQEGEPKLEIEATIKGKHRRVYVSGTRILIHSRAFALIAVEDVSERFVLEAQLRQSQKLEALGQLAAGVAHDFNNILTIVQGNLSLVLDDEALDGGARRKLQQAQGAAERATHLIRKLLTFGRKHSLQRKILDLAQFLEQTTSMFTRLLNDSIEVQLECSSRIRPIFVDQSSLEQVLLNLVVNARDAMPKGGRLTIEAREVAAGAPEIPAEIFGSGLAYVCLRVSDTGEGMPEKVQAHIFEPFYTTKQVGKGTGMGLATVYGIVTQHNGAIRLRSEVNEGTTFEIFLPAAERTEIVDEPMAVNEARGGLLPSSTVLLVEDEQFVRDYVRGLLADHGMQVLTATSAQEALTIWSENSQKVDLLLTDLVMPGGMNGRELGARLLAQKPKLRVAYTSGYSRDVFGSDFELLPGERFFAKPYNPHELIRNLRGMLVEDRALAAGQAQDESARAAWTRA